VATPGKPHRPTGSLGEPSDLNGKPGVVPKPRIWDCSRRAITAQMNR
jgi:hypothetical protein